jgi:hypothetical protein
MSIWRSEELKKIGNAEELEIASMRSDGTLRKPVTIWVVRVVDDLFVRPVNGGTSAWFRGTQTRHEGHMQAAGVEKDVTFMEETDPDINTKIDAAYRSKYHRYPTSYVDSVLTEAARSATIKLVAR